MLRSCITATCKSVSTLQSEPQLGITSLQQLSYSKLKRLGVFSLLYGVGIRMLREHFGLQFQEAMNFWFLKKIPDAHRRHMVWGGAQEGWDDNQSRIFLLTGCSAPNFWSLERKTPDATVGEGQLVLRGKNLKVAKLWCPSNCAIVVSRPGYLHSIKKQKSKYTKFKNRARSMESYNSHYYSLAEIWTILGFILPA